MGEAMIREMRSGEEDKIRETLAKLDYEDQVYWRKQTKSLEELLTENTRIPISESVKGRNVVLVAEEDSVIVGLCWCTIVDNGIDKQGEVTEFYVEKKFRGRGVGKELLKAAKNLFTSEKVGVAFAWTHRGNKTAIKLYREAGFKDVDQVVMAYVLSNESNT